MGTTDGISTDDWDNVHGLAVDIVNAPDNEKTELRQRLFDYLELLEVKYGPLPSILATRADYLDSDDPAREEFLLRAHTSAESRGDVKNLVYVSHSLGELYLERRRLADAEQWLSRMRQYIASCDETTYRADYERLRAEYRKLVINPAPTDQEPV
jgi:hypothetical protein